MRVVFTKFEAPIGSTLHRLSSPKDFSVVSLRKSVAIRFLYQTGASRTQLNTVSLGNCSSFPSCCTYFKFLVDRISGEHFPPTTYGKGPWESMLSQHCWTGLPSHPQRVVVLKTRFQGFIANGKTPQRSEFPEAKNHPSMHGISYLPIYTYRFGCIFMLNVGKYISYMDAMGYIYICFKEKVKLSIQNRHRPMVKCD